LWRIGILPMIVEIQDDEMRERARLGGERMVVSRPIHVNKSCNFYATATLVIHSNSSC
jgi:hypothetical protein